MGGHGEDQAVAARVRAIWADVLAGQVDGPVADDQPFLAAGGHSLAAARLIARLRGELAVEVPMATILREDPTLDQLIDVVIARLGEHPAPLAPPVEADDDPAPQPVTAPLAPTLRRIWTWHRLNPDSPAYNVVRVLSIDGRLQPAVLRAVLADLSARHEALRCAVTEPRPGRPEVVLGDQVAVPLSVEVVRPGSSVEDALRRLADRPFPMATPPLWRVGVVYDPAAAQSYLILVMHHLISDLRTTDLVLTELADAYSARAAGDAPSFKTPAPSLLAHLAHETALVDTPRWREDLEWWSRRLSGAGSAVPLPLSAAERDEQVYAATTHTVELPAAESDALDAALRERRLTPALLFLTAAGSVLAAWSGLDRAEVVGLPSVRISRPEDERLVGFLLDTLPLPVTPEREHSFRHVYQTLRDAYAEAADHARPAFDDVVDRLRLPRTARSPLIRLWFSDLTQAVTPPAIGGLAVTEYDLPPGWALFDLGGYLRRGPGGYRLHLVSPRGLTDPGDLAALAEQILRTATRAAADPDRSLGELLEAPAAAAVTPYAGKEVASTPALIGRQLPAVIALAGHDGVLDYGSLHAEVERAAGELVAAAVVGLPARRDRRFIVRLLACRRAGATAVLVDAEWPQWRRRRAFEVAGVTHAYPWSGDGPPTTVATSANAADGPGHVLFTSGTTGDPLAVRVAASVTDAALDDLAALIGMTPADRVSMLSGPAHDPVLRDLGLALRAGATVCVPPPEVFGDPGRIAAWLRQERVTVVNSTPALLALVFGADPEPLPDLRVVVCGGSPLSVRTAALIRSRAVNATVVDGYGCTETPQLVVANPIAPEQPLPPTAEVPIGTPLPGRRVELRAADGRLCDTGQLGELWVAGPHIAQGYLGGGPAGRFVTNADGSRWLRTGDLARRDAAGRVHLAGRRDRQATVNGHRVMLEEIESVARGCAGVADALAQLVGDRGRQAVRIWAQRAAGAVVSEDAVRAHLATILPAGIVPARVIVVDRLEIGDTLKPVAPPREPVGAGAGSRADARVRQLAESMLGAPLDPATNFFDAGFTSVSLLQMSVELSDLLGRPVEALSLFHHPNLRTLSAFLFGPAGDQPPVRPEPSVADRSDRLARMRASRREVRTWIQESATGKQ